MKVSMGLKICNGIFFLKCSLKWDWGIYFTNIVVVYMCENDK